MTRLSYWLAAVIVFGWGYVAWQVVCWSARAFAVAGL